MKRWHTEGKEITNPNIDAFIEEIFALYKKYNLSIGHEDHHGAFVISADSEINRAWIQDAHDDTE